MGLPPKHLNFEPSATPAYKAMANCRDANGIHDGTPWTHDDHPTSMGQRFHALTMEIVIHHEILKTIKRNGMNGNRLGLLKLSWYDSGLENIFYDWFLDCL